jgi:hypothetical protein
MVFPLIHWFIPQKTPFRVGLGPWLAERRLGGHVRAQAARQHGWNQNFDAFFFFLA